MPAVKDETKPMDDRTYAHRDTSIEPEDQELTAYLYQPYLEAYEAVSYPSIWKARHDDRLRVPAHC